MTFNVPSYFLTIFGHTSLHIEITQVHLLGTLTGMHSRTQWCFTNEKSLGPFRPVRPAGLDVQAQPGTRGARPITISNRRVAVDVTELIWFKKTFKLTFKRLRMKTLLIVLGC